MKSSFPPNYHINKEKTLDNFFHTKSASFAAAANSELTCRKSMQGLPHPFSTTINGTEDELSIQLSWLLIIASTSRPPATAARRRMSQCCGHEINSSLVFTCNTTRKKENRGTYLQIFEKLGCTMASYILHTSGI